MHNLSMTQALYVWSQLEQAYYEDNSYGGTICELYMYLFKPASPGTERQPPEAINEPGLHGDMLREVVDNANMSLYNILHHFQTVRDVNIKVENRALGVWVQTARYQHRVQVQVTRKTE